MKKFIICAAAAYALAAGSAVAADMPAKMYTKAPIMAVPPSWTGWYAGVNAGYGFGTQSNFYTFVPPTGLSFETNYSDRLNGFLGGIQLGYNYQITPNSWVAGIEADLDYANFKGSASNTGTIPGVAVRTLAVTNPWTYNQDQKVNWLSTIRGRLGWTPGDHTFLFYATGGLAVGGVKASDSLSFANGVAWTGSTSKTKVGWALGGGVEARLMDNWSAKFEYIYYDLGHVTVVGTANVATPDTSTTEFGFRGNIIRVGLNKKFTSN